MLAWLRPELSTTQDKNFLSVLGPVVGEDMLFKLLHAPLYLHNPPYAHQEEGEGSQKPVQNVH